MSLLRNFHRGFILPTPVLALRYLADRPPAGKPALFPFSHPHIHYTFLGTTAIYQAIRLLKLQPGDVVLCPAYNCGHELQPFIDKDISLKFYSVNRQLDLDLDEIKGKLGEKTRALLITHFFGFPRYAREIKTLCREHDIYLIEDCAHALFSKDGQDDLGSLGDIAIFSLRKTLPLPNGGAVVINNPVLEQDTYLQPPHAMVTWSKILDLWKDALRLEHRRYLLPRLGLLALLPLLAGRRLLQRLNMFGDLAWVDPDDDRFGCNAPVTEWSMANASRRILSHMDDEQIIATRRRNFQFLLSSLNDIEGFQPLYRHLPDRVCPLEFPVLADDLRRMSGALHDRFILADIWWNHFHPAVPWAEFPEAVYLKEHMLVLPVHQDIEPYHLQKMVDELRQIAGAS